MLHHVSAAVLSGRLRLAHAELPGSAALSLVSKVLPLNREAAVFTAVLSGWADQQRARVCKPPTVQARATLVRRFAEFTGAYPWQWRADDADAFFSKLLSGSEPKADSTVRGYQNALHLFCDFITDARYGWA
jgi:integrase/recombinase XerD